MRKMILPFFLVLLLVSCSIPDEIGLPSWTVPIRLVILNDTFDAEVVSEQVGSFQASGDTLRFHETISESQLLGDIEIEDIDVHNETSTLGEYSSQDVNQLNGQEVNNLTGYPNYVISFDITKDFEPFEEYEQIKFNHGFLNLTITNNTVFWFGDAPNGMPLIAKIFDESGEQILPDAVYDNIAPEGGIGTKAINLADCLMGNTFTVTIFGEGNVTSNSTANIDTSATGVMDITVTEIEAEYIVNAVIEEQSIEPIDGFYDIEFTQPEIVEEDSFRFTGNSSIVFTIDSMIPMVASFDLTSRSDTNEVTLQNIQGNGNPIILDVGIGVTEIELTSEEYNINDILQILPDEFEYTMNPNIGNGTVIPYLSFNDSISIDFEIIADLQIETFEEDGIWIIPLDDGEFSIETQDTEAFDQTMYDAYNSGIMIFKYLNNTGLEVGFDLLVSDESAKIYSEIYIFEEPDTNNVQMFRVPLFEETSGDNYKETEIVVSQSDLEFFINDSVFVFPRVHIVSEGEHPWTGGLKIQADLEIEIDISNDLINEEEE